MTPHHFAVTRLGPREKAALSVTTLFFATAVTLAALGLPVDDVLVLMGGTAGAAVVTVTAITFVDALRATREAEREAVAALVRIAGQS